MRRLPGFISLLPWTGCLGRIAHPPPWAMSWPCSPQQGFHFPGLVPHSFNERPRRLSNSCVTRQLTSPLWAAVAYLNSSHLGEESKLPKWDSRQGHTAWRRSHFQHSGQVAGQQPQPARRRFLFYCPSPNLHLTTVSWVGHSPGKDRKDLQRPFRLTPTTHPQPCRVRTRVRTWGLSHVAFLTGTVASEPPESAC